MPYYTFHDREQNRPEIMGNWKAQLVQFFRSREKEPRKTDSVGIALQSAASQFMARSRMPEKFRPLVIDAIKKYFRIQEHISDPSKPMIGSTKPLGQMRLNFESVFRNTLISEDGDSIIYKGVEYDYRTAKGPITIFIADKTGQSLLYGESTYWNKTHWSTAEAFINNPKSKNIVVINPTEQFTKTIHDIYRDINAHKYLKAYSLGILGRIWWEPKLIGMWSPPNEVAKIINVLQKQLKFTDDFILDFAATTQKDSQITVGDFKKRFGEYKPQQRSAEELRYLIQQHLNPDVKKLTGAKHGSEKNAEVAQKAGYPSTAKFNTTRVIGDSTENE